MSNCNQFNGINCGNMTVGGIQQLWIIPFGEIYDFRYTNNNLNKITDYKLTLRPTEYRVLRAGDSFAQTLQDINNKRSFNQSLTATFAQMSAEKRDEFNKLIGNDLSIIFKDKNGKCWLMGQSSPVRVTKNDSTTGNDAGENIITTDFQCDSKEPIREILCYDGECFTNFNVEELRKSTFIIPSPGSVDFSGLMQITADTTLLTYNPLQPLDPTNWSNPTIYAQDLMTLQTLVSGYPITNLQIELIYDNVFDIAYINFYSNDTTFNNLTFNSSSFVSDNLITLHIWFTLGVGIDVATTTINVSDSTMVDVYEGLLNDVVTGVWTGVTGIVRDAYVDVSTLYPNGTTLYLTVLGNSQCETKTFTYVTEDYSKCSTSIDTDIVEGSRYSVDFDKFQDSGEFRNFQFYFDGHIIQLFATPVSYVDGFPNFVSAFLDSIYSFSPSNIDLGSIVITDYPKKVNITFNSTNNNALCYVLTTGNEENMFNYKHIFKATKTVVLNVQTNTTSPNISFTNNNSDVVSGINGNTPDVNTGVLTELTPDTTGNIESIGLVFDSEMSQETDPFIESITSTDCPNNTISLYAPTCYSQSNTTTPYLYYKIELVLPNTGVSSSMGSNFTFNLDSGTFVLPELNDEITGDCDYAEFTKSINDNISSAITFKVLSFIYDHPNQRYLMEFYIDYNDVFYDMTADDISTSSTTLDECYVDRHKFNDVIHPSIQCQLYVPTISSIQTPNTIGAFINRTGGAGEPFVEYDLIDEVVSDYYYDSGLDELTLTLQVPNNNINDYYRFDFKDTHDGAVLISYQLTAPTLTDTFNFAADLALVGKTLNDVNWVFITNGEDYLLDIVCDAFNLQDVAYTLRHPRSEFRCFGRFQDMFNLSRTVGNVIVTDVLSELCPIFRPSDLTSCTAWNRTDLAGSDQGNLIDNVTLTQDSNSFTTTTPALYKIGNILSTETPASYGFQVIDIVGTTIYLNQKIPFTTGSYDIYMLYPYVIDSFNGNALIYVNTGTAYVQWNGLNGYPIYSKTADAVYAFNSPFSTDPEELVFIGIIKGSGTVTDKDIFTHGDNPTNIPIELYVNSSNDFKAESTDGTNTAQISLGTSSNYSIVTFSFIDNGGGTFTISGSINGNTYVSDTQTKVGSFTSAVECFGGYFDGSVFNNGFTGEFAELIVLNTNSINDKQKCEGYLAWKFGMVSLLPLTHPYKTFRP